MINEISGVHSNDSSLAARLPGWPEDGESQKRRLDRHSSALLAEPEGMKKEPMRILLTDTNRYVQPARLAIAFAELGCEVGVVCPAHGHPVHAVPAVRSRFVYRASSPLHSLRTAIRVFDPDLIVPVCDCGVGHLHRLYAAARANGEKALSDLIERSLGSPTHYDTLLNRYKFLSIAEEEGIRIPDQRLIEEDDNLAWCEGHSAGTWAIKADGSWGGDGVWPVKNHREAQDALKVARRQRPMKWILKRLSQERSPGFIVSEWLQPSPRLSAQKWIDGRPSNCAVACLKGRVIAISSIVVMASNGPKGPSTVVELVENQEMKRAAERIADRFGLSGFFGLDFILESATGRAFLIEINPRSTALTCLALGAGHDLPATLIGHLTGRPQLYRPPVTELKRIAFFPENRDRSASDFLPGGSYYLDIPHGYPELIHRLQRQWPKFSIIRFLIGLGLRMRRRKST